jgi:hypothetical protein
MLDTAEAVESIVAETESAAAVTVSEALLQAANTAATAKIANTFFIVDFNFENGGAK